MRLTETQGAALVARSKTRTKGSDLSRPALKLKIFEPSEAQVLYSVLAALAHCRSVAWFERFNSGAGRLSRPDGETSQWMRFGFPGCPDIIGQMADGRFLGIEIKRPSWKAPRDDHERAQTAFLERSRAHGGVAGIVRSVDEAIALVA